MEKNDHVVIGVPDAGPGKENGNTMDDDELRLAQMGKENGCMNKELTSLIS